MQFWNSLAAFGSLIGGLAAALSVIVAFRSYARIEAEKVIDNLKGEIVSLKILFSDFDKNIDFSLYLDVAERLKLKVTEYICPARNLEDLEKKLKRDDIRVTLSRMMILALVESQVNKRSGDLISEMNARAVTIGQTLPISGHVIRMCLRIAENTASAAVDPTLFTTKMTEDAFRNIVDTMRANNEDYDLFVDDFVSLVSDSAGDFIRNKGQGVIDDTRTIIDVITAALSSMSYKQLKKLEAVEKANQANVLYSTKTLTGDLGNGLTVLKPFIPTSEWDKVLSSKTRIDSVFAAQANK